MHAGPRVTPAVRRVASTVAALVVALAAGVVPAAHAADQDATWGIRPEDNAHGAERPNFAYELDPGAVVEDALLVTNRGSEPLDLTVYAADAFLTSSGQYDLLPAGTPSTDLGAWVRVGLDRVTVAPGEQVRVPFTVAVPADASPGDHAGGVLTSSIAATGTTVAIDRRLASRVQVRVSGDLVPAVDVTGVRATYHPSWNPFAAGTVTVDYTLSDVGNTRLTATETAMSAGPLGVGRARSDVLQAPELLAGSVVTRQVAVPGVWPTVRLATDLEVRAEGVGLGAGMLAPVSVRVTGWAIPWAQLVLLGLVVAAAASGPSLLARVRGRGASPDPPATPATPATSSS